MANRKISPETKAAALSECLVLRNVEEVSDKYGISAGTIRYCFREKVTPALPEIVANRKTGPKAESVPLPDTVVVPPTPTVSSPPAMPDDGRPDRCPQCGSQKVWKNGRYGVINWLVFLIFRVFTGAKVLVQRYRCGDCDYEIPSPERLRLAEARRRGWIVLRRLVCFSKFKLRLSHRRTQLLALYLCGKNISLAVIDHTVQTIGAKAAGVLGRIGDCRQKVARMIMADETFPKILGKARSLGVVICERGLIRGVKCVVNQARDMSDLLRGAVGKHYRPQFFLSDFEVHYPKIATAALEKVCLLKDVVHAMRLLFKYFDEAVRDVTLKVPHGLSRGERKKQKQLKQRLLRKQLQPILQLFLKALSPGYESVASIYVEGALALLQDEKVVIQNESVQRLYRKLRRFFNKHGHTLYFQLEHRQELEVTTNALESKNSIFKPFSLIAKLFQTAQSCENFFSGVALWENFEVKSRGKHRGTSAIQRAGIDLNELGGKDFFEVVGLSLETRPALASNLPLATVQPALLPTLGEGKEIDGFAATMPSLASVSLT